MRPSVSRLILNNARGILQLTHAVHAFSVLVPLLALYTIKTHNIADDPVFIVTATLVIGSAPAITLAQMTNAVGNSFERLISKTLFVSYVIVTFPSTIALVLIGLEIAERQ